MSKKMTFLSRPLHVLLMLFMVSPYSFASSSKITSTSNQNTQEQNVAQAVSQAGQMLQDNSTSQGASALVGSVLSNVANQNLQEQLNRYGNARIQLNVDENFSLKNSQFDLLLPIWEEQDNLFFTQGSFHRTNDRNQGNLGLGLRHFADEYMLGANTFFDYDLSRHHSRLGVGLEYWRNYLKLSSNGYIHLSGWKNSTDLANYEERAANGLDVRAEGFLPIYPQIGAKLMYEQYFGDEVALFNKDTREINPYAVTVGMTYTPVPLLTFNIDQRQGKSGQHDTRLGLQMNYQLGQSLDKQLSAGEVATMRSLAGSRYDFVERNNNIVLEYRKKEAILLRTVNVVTGYAGDQKSLEVSVTSEHGLDRIDWSAPAFLAAGGKIVQEGTSGYSVILPSYNANGQGMNSWVISGVAIDKKGNSSNRSETHVTVLNSGAPMQVNSAISVDSDLYIIGSDMTVTVTLKDVTNQGIIGKSALLTPETVKIPNAEPKSTSSWQDNGDGTYSIIYTAKSAGENLKATMTLDGWSSSAESMVYSITEPVTLKDISVDNYTFEKDAGFPTTGFKGAMFTLNLSSGSASDFNWTSDATSWVSVNDGVVSFTGVGNKNKVTITGTPKSGVGDAITYSFTLSNWYINNGIMAMVQWQEGNTYCSIRPGYKLPTVQQLNGNASHSDGSRGSLGALWSEWGDLTTYPDAEFTTYYYWTSEQSLSGRHYSVGVYNGHVLDDKDYYTRIVACVQEL